MLQNIFFTNFFEVKSLTRLCLFCLYMKLKKWPNWLKKTLFRLKVSGNTAVAFKNSKQTLACTFAMFGKVKVLRTEKIILNESKRKDLQLRLWVKHCQITTKKSFQKFQKKDQISKENFKERICGIKWLFQEDFLPQLS